MHFSKNRFSISLLAAALVVGLPACSNKDDKKTATQVAAKVDSEEISVHQINQLLSRANTGNASPEATKAMGSEMLEKLIDQQLAVTQATENKLHRSPEVVTQIEAARRDILARAYLQQIGSALPKITPEEATAYYAANPPLFSERRIYNVQEIVVPAAPGMVEELRSFSASGKSIEEIAALLKSKDIKFGGGVATRAAEQIPLDLLKQLHVTKDGQSIVIGAPKTVTLLRVVSSQVAPINEATALPRIEQFLSNQRASEAMAAKIKELRAAAKITYLGDFAKTEGDAPAAPPAAAAPPPTTDNKATSAIEKGVAGLK